MPYDSSSKFVLFFNREACERSSLTEADLNFYLYTAAMMNDIQAPENVYALVAKGDKRLTACVPGQKDGERIVFQMHSNVVAGKRLVMVVENSQGLSAAGGKHIKRGIMRWLQELKELERSLPLSLFVVRGGNDVQEFLRGEDLSRLPFESQNDALPSLVGLVSEYLNFIGQGFQPLHNLAHIGQKTMQDGVKKVLYLTDSYGIPDTIDDSQVGTLLGWKLDGVEVTVLTNGDCAKWDYKHLVNCEQLPQILTETFMKNRLKNWLN
ncbi:hypothetical protein CSB45_02895 [candidate division KSB3 bacterium]|uniref:VWFA domain-containing protein n=1 Tax=candidate division KSB3 bacterium TaxID=2044937 RepID=A0A2G6E9R0_9BACT|nr:MAG: hypothetical protein CSB45_02895 [candidate division KSB3 bacterium]PIE29014.1 MAG: hypothetical protein CSA57_11185 [candidate division KSB3 bacterium]